MKHLTTIFLALLCIRSLGQETMTDCRDNQTYPVVNIDGTLWMAENLFYESTLSSPTSNEQKATRSDLSGRYYHVNELDSICPCDWILPDAEDWINYFEYLSSVSPDNPQIKLSLDKSHLAFFNYENVINLFDENNPLKLIPTGRLEGGQYFLPENTADYWTADPPNFSEGNRNERSGVVHILPEVYDGRTHIHMRGKGFTNIHSHKHHMDPEKEKKLRKFMVRCVKR